MLRSSTCPPAAANCSAEPADSVHIGAGFYEGFHAVDPVIGDGGDQGRDLGAVLLFDGRARLEQSIQHLDVAVGGGDQQRGRTLCRGGVDVHASVDQQLQHFQIVLGRHQYEGGCVVAIPHLQIRTLRQQSLDDFHVPAQGSSQQRRGAAGVMRVDMRAVFNEVENTRDIALR
jgi:hypothetical protein